VIAWTRVLAAGAALALLAASPALALPYSDRIVFGDRLVHAGNAFVSVVPEPDTSSLLALGLLVLALRRNR
jgi:hypothetical protein